MPIIKFRMPPVAGKSVTNPPSCRPTKMNNIRLRLPPAPNHSSVVVTSDDEGSSDLSLVPSVDPNRPIDLTEEAPIARFSMTSRPGKTLAMQYVEYLRRQFPEMMELIILGHHIETAERLAEEERAQAEVENWQLAVQLAEADAELENKPHVVYTDERIGSLELQLAETKWEMRDKLHQKKMSRRATRAATAKEMKRLEVLVRNRDRCIAGLKGDLSTVRARLGEPVSKKDLGGLRRSERVRVARRAS